jgi:hypothetical protein
MKITVIGMIGLLILAGDLSAQKTPNYSVRNSETFSGEITDSICAEGHQIEMIKSAKNCILTCVKVDGAQFALYNTEIKRIYKLDDQQQPETFAGQEVIVTGRYDKDAKAIHVVSIRPKITYAVLRGRMSSYTSWLLWGAT